VSGLPLFVNASHLRVLVVGGGDVAARKVKQFAAARAQLRVVAIDVTAELDRLARVHAIPVERRAYASGDIGDAHLVFAATSDRATNEAIARDADALGRLANVTDDAQGGAFSVMAMHRRGPLTIAVNAGGVPTAAIRVRDAIAERFDARYGDALEEIVAVRRRLLAEGKVDEWRKCADALLGPDFLQAVELGQISQRLAPWR
jgi:precorrin-2 dehydrogenase / sirohydrochlorin ferrochelatase